LESFHSVRSRTRTLTFDCYGTLIDWDTGLARVFREVLGPQAEARRREMFDAYVQIEAAVESEPYRPYREVLAITFERLAKRLSLPLPADRRDAIARMLPDWKPFADTNEALARLKKRFRLGVVSNIDRDLFTGTARHFAVPFDSLICAEDVGSYKPALGHFERLKQQEGSLDGILHVAQSLYHDGMPAEQLGLAFVWINRYNEPNRTTVRPLGEFPDLRSFADAACD
jgi:2-haloalkanoic acid dehalogenase type II